MLSPEREGRFTASNHAVPLGLGYSSQQKFWRQWHGLEEFDEFAKARMAWGAEHEVDALGWYEAETGEIVTRCLDRQVFIPFQHWSGATPDGFVGPDGLVDFKCPTKLYDEPHAQYWVQLQSQMHHADKQWADLCAWTPDEGRIWRTERVANYWDEVGPILEAYWHTLTKGMEPKRSKKPKLNLEVSWKRIA